MKKRGVGFAAGWKGAGYHFGHPDTSTVWLVLSDNLRLQVKVAAADLGQGIPDTIRTIVSRELGDFPKDRIDFVDPDTAVTPDGGATGASRHTSLTGNAALLASKKMLRLLKTVASEILDTPPHNVFLLDGSVYGRDGSSVELSQIVQECKLTGLTLEVRATYRGALTEPLDQETGQGFGVSQFSYATYIAEVEVDTDTGEVSVLRVDTFIDAGRVVRPKGAEMQVEGGVVMGLGHTLTEEFVQKEGLPQTEGLATYLIPTIADVPFDINCTFVDERAPIGELGAKGLAELTLVPIAPAIINAIYDAVGVRITRLPASPERVLLAIEGQRFGKTTKDTYD